MGSTITCNRRVAATPSSSGTIYFLFEETYSSNVFPQTPSRSCVHIGNLASAIKRIFDLASSCEGGGLRARSGSILPESYIQSWLKELAKPFEMRGRASLRRSKGEYDYRGVSEKTIEAVRPMLTAEMAASIDEKGEAYFDCINDAEILANLVSAGVSGWVLIEDCWIDDQPRNASLGYAPAPAKMFTLVEPQGYRMPDGNNVLLLDADGVWRVAGWDYRIVGRFISASWEAELALPGSYRRRIKAYRAAVKASLPLPAGTTVLDAATGETSEVTEENSRGFGWRARDELAFAIGGGKLEAQLIDPVKPQQLMLFAA